VLVCGMGALWVSEVLPYGIGPNLDTVRLMDANTPRLTRWRQQRHRRRLARELQCPSSTTGLNLLDLES
jgi:hypothetical protein